MGMFFAPIANVVLSAVYPDQEGKASGANNAIREVGGVFGVAVLASIFSANGSYRQPAGLRRRARPGRVGRGGGRRPCAAVVALAIPARVAAGIRRPVTVPALARPRTDVDLRRLSPSLPAERPTPPIGTSAVLLVSEASLDTLTATRSADIRPRPT